MCTFVELSESFDYANEINVYNNGVITVFCAGDEVYNEILMCWKSMIKTAHEMPAYGVSLDNETRRVIKEGIWLEFVFDKTYESNGMPYEKLLINVEKEWHGFNLIRFNTESGYDGRCFYYDLVGNNMSNLYDVLLKL